MSARPIIGAVDVFTPSPTAGDCARWLAVESGAPLELVYVFDPGSLPALGRIEPGMRQELYDLQDARVKARATERLATITSASPGIRTSATIAEGLPVPTLHELADERRAGMIVAGTAAREGLEHVLQGSVPESSQRMRPVRSPSSRRTLTSPIRDPCSPATTDRSTGVAHA